MPHAPSPYPASAPCPVLANASSCEQPASALYPGLANASSCDHRWDDPCAATPCVRGTVPSLAGASPFWAGASAFARASGCRGRGDVAGSESVVLHPRHHRSRAPSSDRSSCASAGRKQPRSRGLAIRGDPFVLWHPARRRNCRTRRRRRALASCAHTSGSCFTCWWSQSSRGSRASLRVLAHVGHRNRSSMRLQIPRHSRLAFVESYSQRAADMSLSSRKP